MSDQVPGTAIRGALSDEERARAALLNRAHGCGYPLRRLWEELVFGQLRVVDSYTHGTHCFLTLVAARADMSNHRKLSRSRRAIAERVLGGEEQKVVALELRRSPSTVTAALSECLASLGLDCRGSKAPILIVMAAHAATADSGPMLACRSEFVASACGECAVIGVRRPDTRLAKLLTAAEYDAARLLLDGKSHFDIARIRGSSRRTVANQLRAAFQKTGASGRAQLLSRLIRSADASEDEGDGALSERAMAVGPQPIPAERHAL